MRCHICDAHLNDDEISRNPQHDDWDPCRKCQIIIDEVFGEDKTEEEIEVELDDELGLSDEEELENVEEDEEIS